MPRGRRGSGDEAGHSALENGWVGPSIIERLEKQMDKRRKTWGGMLIHHGKAECERMSQYWINKGRYEGLAAALAIMRSSTVEQEVSRSNVRLGIE